MEMFRIAKIQTFEENKAVDCKLLTKETKNCSLNRYAIVAGYHFQVLIMNFFNECVCYISTVMDLVIGKVASKDRRRNEMDQVMTAIKVTFSLCIDSISTRECMENREYSMCPILEAFHILLRLADDVVMYIKWVLNTAVFCLNIKHGAFPKDACFYPGTFLQTVST